MIALALAIYGMVGVGFYRGLLRNGFKDDSTYWGRTKARAVYAAISAAWPYLVGYNVVVPKTVKYYGL